MFFKIFNNRKKNAVEGLYSSIVNQSRRKRFYLEWHVPDTVEGRFDMIALHVILVLDRLEGEGKQMSEVGQQIFDRFFVDMEDNLRELGVSDLRVPKKVKKMAEKFYGRVKAYRMPLANNDADELSSAFKRIIFSGVEGTVWANLLAAYALKTSDTLRRQPIAGILSGEVSWINPSETVEKE